MADDNLSEIEHVVGGGFAWTGLIPSRDDDILGAGFSHANFSNQAGAGFSDDGETAFELFYKVQITPFASLKPDLQYIVNPGGAGLADALVGTLRIEVAF